MTEKCLNGKRDRGSKALIGGRRNEVLEKTTIQSNPNPNPSTAASERKRLGDDDSDSENERDIPQTCEETAREDPGYRLVHLSSMKQAFEKNLPSAQMILVEDEGKRFGQSSVFSIQCSKCKMETNLHGSQGMLPT